VADLVAEDRFENTSAGTKRVQIAGGLKQTSTFTA